MWQKVILLIPASENFIVSRTTGVISKNGVEVYEFDRVKWIDHRESERFGIVTFEKGRFSIFNCGYSIDTCKDIEVVGTELLDKK